MNLCLNMIVRNERAIIERCLASVVNHISSYVIADTGSTDGTQDVIRKFFAERGIPGEIVEFPFEDFAQARNGALAAAEASTLDFDYMLLIDADMELVVLDDKWAEGLSGVAYSAAQKTSSLLDYDNVRIVKRGVGAKYISVTHEYISTPEPAQRLSTIEFLDHACGSNRADKAARDIRLLRKGLEDEPGNPRYHFYLAQTLREIGEFEEARDLYAKRAAIPDFEEEAWYSAMCEAICERHLGHNDAFEVKMLAAWQRRPWRAEPLYHLALHYMNERKNAIAAMFAEEGLRIPYPKGDILFKEASIYKFGFKVIYSIAGFYAPGRRTNPFYYCNWVSMCRDVPANQRAAANQNMQHYLAPLSTFMDSWKAKRIEFTPEPGWYASNPSIANVGGYPDAVLRTVNYKVDFRKEGAFYVTPDGAQITTRNFYVKFNSDLDILDTKEILPPADLPEPAYNGIRGFEDLRLAAVGLTRYVNGTFCERTPNGEREMSLAVVDDHNRLTAMRIVEPDGLPKRAEKNWMPVIYHGHVHYVYSCDPVRIVDAEGRTVLEREPSISGANFRGGTQLVPFDGGYLCAVHEVAINTAENRRTYFHRFVWFDSEFDIKRVSPPFVFNKPRFEFAAGLCWLDTNRLALSYGVDDCEAWVGVFDQKDLADVLQDVAQFR